MNKDKVLIIEAHSDDSAISIAGFLEKYRDMYEYHFLLTAASSMHLHHYGFLTREQRLEEYARYVEFFGGIWHKNEELPIDAESNLDTIPRKKIVALLEKVIFDVKPKILICQGPSFHHDHSIVYESMIASTRPTARFYPDEIYIMENPTYVHSIGPQTDFKPDLYVSLSKEDMLKKVDCYRNYFPTQMREDKNLLSENGITSWARYRGIEARCDYAEALRTYSRII